MISRSTTASETTAFGRLLRRFRGRAGHSQLDLGFRAGVSARHISFLETGRSAPSRQMVLRLARALDTSRRETNQMFLAAGFAPLYSEVDLASPRAADVRAVVEFLLVRHEPYSGLACDRLGNIVATNAAHRRLVEKLLPGGDTPPEVLGNLLRLVFHPAGLRHAIANWEDVASAVSARFRQDVEREPDTAARQLLEEILSYDLPSGQMPVLPDDRPLPLMLPLQVRRDTLALDLITIVTTLGSALDVTLSELRIETYFPADDRSDAVLHELAGDDARSGVQWHTTS